MPARTRVSKYPYSHSLSAQVIWGLAAGAVHFAIRRNIRAAVVLAVCVPSHWILDFLSHRPDMPLFPDSARYGLGLWNSRAATLAVELILFAIGIILYLTATAARDLVGQWALWSFLILLLLVYLGSGFGPPPPSEHLIALSALAIWLTVPWAEWIDRHRRTLEPDAIHGKH